MNCAKRAQHWVILAAAAALALGLAGCGRDDGIAVYQAPKETQPAAVTPGGDPAAVLMRGPEEPQTIQWTAPAGWKAMPAGQMRYAVFAVNDATPPVLVTVIPLGREAGQLLPNVNRWEQQVGLSPSSEAELPKVVKHVTLADFSTADVVDLIGPEAQAGAARQRILAAIVRHGDRVWFFKLAGPADVVGGQKAAFEQFLQSVHFGGGGDGATSRPAVP